MVDLDVIDGRYRRGVVLGAGAFGSVYKAQQLVAGKEMRAVALKVFHCAALSPDKVEQMMADALTIIALLSDLDDWEIRQHFVTIYDLGITREEPPRGYVAMELVRGGSLEGRLRDFGKFTLQATFPYLLQIARAMAFMHAEGFVHSDLKPANVLVFGSRGHELIKIGDFGLAGRYVSPFANGLQGGTLSYLPLESLHGLPTTPAADVFAMGVMAYEMLKGDNPYERAGRTLDPKSPSYQADLVQVQIMARQEPLALKVDDFPEAQSKQSELHGYLSLLNIVNRMLEPSPERRYANARRVLEDLQGMVNLRDAAPPEETPDPVAKLLRDFQGHLGKGHWPNASLAAKELVSLVPQRPEGYLCKSQVSLAQADQAGPDFATIQRLRHQAVGPLVKALNCCPAPEAQQQLRLALAKIYQLLGDEAMVRQYRQGLT